MSIQCPHCQGELNAGQLLSELSRGKRRTMTPEHKAKLAESLKIAREKLALKRAADQKQQWTIRAEANKITLAKLLPLTHGGTLGHSNNRTPTVFTNKKEI